MNIKFYTNEKSNYSPCIKGKMIKKILVLTFFKIGIFIINFLHVSTFKVNYNFMKISQFCFV